MMLVQHLLDRDLRVEIPGVDTVRNQFDRPREALALALDQERTVTDQVGRLTAVARDEGDFSASSSCSGSCRNRSKRWP